MEFMRSDELLQLAADRHAQLRHDAWASRLRREARRSRRARSHRPPS